MKLFSHFTLLVITAVLMISCGVQRDGTGRNKTGEKLSPASRLALRDTSATKDSVEYELIIFDPGFEFWLHTKSFSKHQYSNEYLQTTNHQYVTEWNRRYAAGDHRIESYIDYSPFNDYDFELNYKLFMYFRYFEETYKVKLLTYRGR